MTFHQLLEFFLKGGVEIGDGDQQVGLEIGFFGGGAGFIAKPGNVVQGLTGGQTAKILSQRAETGKFTINDPHVVSTDHDVGAVQVGVDQAFFIVHKFVFQPLEFGLNLGVIDQFGSFYISAGNHLPFPGNANVFMKKEGHQGGIFGIDEKPFNLGFFIIGEMKVG